MTTPTRVFFPCTGLGRQQRGFESFTVECANALRSDKQLDITVFSGASVREVPAHPMWNTARDSRAARILAAFHRRGPYFSEQLTFFLSFLPHLRGGKPDVVYFADLNLGNLCWHWRRLSGQTYRLLFYNGGLTTKPFTRADLVQQLTPEGLAEATLRGEDRARQVVVPHGVNIAPVLAPRITGEARRALGLPPNRQIVLSVGLLDATVKRMDYVIREVASLPELPFLLLLGAESEETPGVLQLANDMLGKENFLMRTVPREDIPAYYRASDVFILASLREGFGLAYVEAIAHGLPVVAHDFAVSRYLLDPFATFGDLEQPGEATGALLDILASGVNEGERQARHAFARARFGWDMLRDDYSAMLRRAATMPMVGAA